MFGRKKRHIRFLMIENEMLRRKMEMAEQYADGIVNGNILKAVLLNPNSIRDNQLVITQKELDVDYIVKNNSSKKILKYKKGGA